MTEPTRPLRDPVVQQDGSLLAKSVATPTSFNVRGRAYVDSFKVIPVVFVPGTMGSNLRVRRDISLPPGFPLHAGEPAWRPPNTLLGGLRQANGWDSRKPEERQMILNPSVLEVDDGGFFDIEQTSLEPSVMRERGWGEVFSSSYGALLAALERDLNMTFGVDLLGERYVRQTWQEVLQVTEGDTADSWGVKSLEPATKTELEKHASYHYPVYAFGYNWLQSCAVSALSLERRVLDIIAWWQSRRRECHQVILLTHSMGGLVARCCAKRIPDKIAGVIHGVMPAYGAPLAYRRIACGTEVTNPSNGPIDDMKAEKFAKIAGKSTKETTPVMAAAPGPLELLPNQFYPRPWLHVRVIRSSGPTGPRKTAFDFLHLPSEDSPNPYDLYRDTRSWYRLIDPELADPAKLYRFRTGGVSKIIGEAIASAESFHRELGDYYHPSTFAYFGRDKEHLAYGQIRWLAHETTSTGSPLTAGSIRRANFVRQSADGARTVEVDERCKLTFVPEPQDAPGDDTVPHQSGAGPSGKVRALFTTKGYRHQESYQDSSMVLLTRYCILKIVQGLQR